MNQASVLLPGGSVFSDGGGSWPAFGTVVSSSAVPVLPATVVPGMAARTPVPYCTTPSMSVRISLAMWREVTRTGLPGGLPGRRVGRWRIPREAIVCAIEASSSGVASTWP